jgi:hypothetical protein
MKTINPNYAIGFAKVVLMLEFRVFAKNLSLTKGLSDDFLTNAISSMISTNLVNSIT